MAFNMKDYENFLNMYAASGEENCSPDSEMEDFYADELFFENYEKENAAEELRIAKKSIARNRHLYKLKAAKSAKKKAEFVTAREMREDVKRASKLRKKLSKLEKKFFDTPFSGRNSIEKEVDKTFNEHEKVMRRMKFREKVLERQNKKELIAASKKSKRKKSA